MRRPVHLWPSGPRTCLDEMTKETGSRFQISGGRRSRPRGLVQSEYELRHAGQFRPRVCLRRCYAEVRLGTNRAPSFDATNNQGHEQPQRLSSLPVRKSSSASLALSSEIGRGRPFATLACGRERQKIRGRRRGSDWRPEADACASSHKQPIGGTAGMSLMWMARPQTTRASLAHGGQGAAGMSAPIGGEQNCRIERLGRLVIRSAPPSRRPIERANA